MKALRSLFIVALIALFGAARYAAADDGPLALTVEQAVLRSLANNRSLRVERLNPPIRRTFEMEERASFDPVIGAEAAASREKAETRAGAHTRTNATGGSVGVSEFLPTGTEIAIDLGTERTWGTALRDRHATRGGLTVTQALLRGVGLGPNLSALRQARLTTRISEYELQGFAEALVADVEDTYWEYILAVRQIAIYEESLELSRQQLEETRQRIRVGGMAETELAAAQAEIALRMEALINARSRARSVRVRLLRLIQPELLAGDLPEVRLLSEPAVPADGADALSDHVALALRMRPELNEARLEIEQGNLEIVRTKNGLLPRLDLFVTLGKTGYADSFGRSVGDAPHDGYDVAAGLTFEMGATNRDARARHQRAKLTRVQLLESCRNLEDLVREDVNTAYIEVERTRQQVDATAATRRLQEEKLRAEAAKFRVGRSTALLVATAQRDLVASQVGEIAAVVGHLQALTNLYRMDGSLLQRRGHQVGGP